MYVNLLKRFNNNFEDYLYKNIIHRNTINTFYISFTILILLLTKGFQYKPIFNTNESLKTLLTWDVVKLIYLDFNLSITYLLMKISILSLFYYICCKLFNSKMKYIHIFNLITFVYLIIRSRNLFLSLLRYYFKYPAFILLITTITFILILYCLILCIKTLFKITNINKFISIISLFISIIFFRIVIAIFAIFYLFIHLFIPT